MTKDVLNKLLDRRKKLDEQIRLKRNRIKTEQTKRARKEDARRKIITGALALDHAAANPNSPFAATLLELLEVNVRPTEKHLFGLGEPKANDNTGDIDNGFIDRLSRAFGKSGGSKK